MTQTQNNEQDVRIQILDSFLTTPHRKLEELAPLHSSALERDPLFYGHLAPWYFDKGAVRDHKTLFVAHLATSEFPEFRGAAWMLLQKLAPFEVVRVLDHSKRVIGKTPRSLKSAIAHYLRTREDNVKQFDGAALRARDDLKHLYASLRLKPGVRAQAILFDDTPPADSPLAALKQLAGAESVEEQARIIRENKIPYTTAIGAVKQVTPALLLALVQAMSPQEVINSMASLKRRGALDDQEVKALIEQKLEEAKSDKRVSAFKAKVAVEAAELAGEVAKKLEAVTEAQVKARGRIKRPTALLIDKSSSMHEAIDLGRQIGAMISTICESDLFTYAFDTAAHPISVQGSTLVDWERAMLSIYASGATACGTGLERLRTVHQRVEQVIIVTDENENRAPYFKDAYTAYVEHLSVQPEITLVKVGQASDTLEQTCTELGIAANTFEFKGDYYALTNLIPLLSRPSRAELLAEIMEYPLPVRRSA
ncbi:MAG: hypothetical protein JOZ18_06705 [Chloroflexi bacterium]|nr:hypothetical protein [Chloroflexota bacterium]